MPVNSTTRRSLMAAMFGVTMLDDGDRPVSGVTIVGPTILRGSAIDAEGGSCFSGTDHSPQNGGGWNARCFEIGSNQQWLTLKPPLVVRLRALAERYTQGVFWPDASLTAAADEIERLRGSLAKIADRYPCRTADAMARLAKETLGP